MNASVVPLDLKQFLTVSLSSQYPELAARIVQFDDGEMNGLRQRILVELQRRPTSLVSSAFVPPPSRQKL
jgi:hypothetical protein